MSRLALVVPVVLLAVAARPAVHASVQEWQPDCAMLRTVYLAARAEGESKMTRYAVFRAASTFTNASRTTFEMDASISPEIRAMAGQIEDLGEASQRESIDDLNKATNVLASTRDAYRAACPEEAAYVINQLLPR